MTTAMVATREDQLMMRHALRLAKRGYGRTSPNPMVGAVLVRQGRIIGQGWHHRAGEPHAEIEAFQNAEKLGYQTAGADLFVTLEPCSTHGRTPPCTNAILAKKIIRVVIGAVDPNPAHAGAGLRILKRAGIQVQSGVLAEEATAMNEAFNHWIVQKTPFVTLKAAMTIDGKTGTAAGDSKWITSPDARKLGMRLRFGADGIMVGINTVLLDDPSLTVRLPSGEIVKPLRRFVLDTHARTPLTAKLASDEQSHLTTVVVGENAPRQRVNALKKKVIVWQAPLDHEQISLPWLMRELGKEQITQLLVEGGGETAFSFLRQRLAHRAAFFYAPKILAGACARKGVAGTGFESNFPKLKQVKWMTCGPDLFMTGLVVYDAAQGAHGAPAK